ncbi:hypothetical protein D1B33_04870 [Lysinibacillus yapensis]|uniref:Uncharacterized protein n=1 Tax=Ureibacillus yapensis TaxID=2304605 RepID=A0A396SAU8_9BACL|nr:hypothetical protein [Lysinibacillus yapensis]RHW38223.1 hypothetical protein D1B33_04870 [Lysinibacillus yapensis]
MEQELYFRTDIGEGLSYLVEEETGYEPQFICVYRKSDVYLIGVKLYYVRSNKYCYGHSEEWILKEMSEKGYEWVYKNYPEQKKNRLRTLLATKDQ